MERRKEGGDKWTRCVAAFEVMMSLLSTLMNLEHCSQSGSGSREEGGGRGRGGVCSKKAPARGSGGTHAKYFCSKNKNKKHGVALETN